MKHSMIILLTSILIFAGNSVQGNPNKLAAANEALNDSSLLDFYRQYSSFTDPGEYEYLYENLPGSLPELCALIKSQSIHPYGELPGYKNIIPEERWDEYYNYTTVESILAGLMSYDSSGIVKDRKIADRLVLSCRENAIILASILKYRGIPARIRYGFAPYLIPGFHAGHVICEVWNENDKRWMLVDPTAGAGMIDFSRERFDFSNDVWLKMQNEEIDPNLYGIPGQFTGSTMVLTVVCTDLASILGTEYSFLSYPPIMDYAYENDNQLTTEQTALLNEISELMKSIDAENFSELQDIYNNNPEIQMTLTLDLTALNDDSNSVNGESSKLSDYSLSQNYPNPFNPTTTISYSIRAQNIVPQQVTLSIYNSIGQKVATLVNTKQPAGNYQVKWNANGLSSGVYLYCLEIGDFRQVKKMTLLR